MNTITEVKKQCPGVEGPSDGNGLFICNICGRHTAKRGYVRFLTTHKAPADVVNAWHEQRRQAAEAALQRRITKTEAEKLTEAYHAVFDVKDTAPEGRDVFAACADACRAIAKVMNLRGAEVPRRFDGDGR